MSESARTSTISKESPESGYFAGNTKTYMSAESLSMLSLFKNRVANHIIFWVVTVLVSAYYGSLFGGAYWDNLTNMVTLLPVQVMAAYMLVYLQIPRWLFKGEWFKFFVSLVICTYAMGVLARLTIIYVAEPLLDMEEVIDESFWEILTDPGYLIRVYIVTIYLPAIVLFLIKMTKERFVHQRRVATLQKEKRTNELNFLKAQMNPHFLFNTLNNIYSLARRQAEQTPDMILKLSEILDYTIYECEEGRVSILREWALIENYADLEALRYSDQFDLSLRQDIDDETADIAPLILISIVENAFKYALGSKSVAPSVLISLVVKDGHLTFEVYNTRSSQQNVKPDGHRGIGVQNIKRQLALQYPDTHNMGVVATEASYKVVLKIRL